MNFCSTDINTIVKFANLCNKFGEKDHAHALFEQILVSYPKRNDVWSQYVDVLVKCGDIDIARYATLSNTLNQSILITSFLSLFSSQTNSRSCSITENSDEENANDFQEILGL